MNSFEIAIKFFEACEAPLGWEGCKMYVQEGALFTAQSEPLGVIHILSNPMYQWY
jgi:hypothetical protein